MKSGQSVFIVLVKSSVDTLETSCSSSNGSFVARTFLIAVIELNQPGSCFGSWALECGNF